MTPLLRAENITIAVGAEQYRVVHSAGFDLFPGEILGIVGESGCGKTLTALSLAGLLPRAASLVGGSIVFDGRELRDLSPPEFSRIRGRDLSFIFQEPALSLNPLIRAGPQIAETLVLGRRGGGRDSTAAGKNRRRAEIRAAEKRQTLDLMARLGLEEPERVYVSYPHQLSGGMCQRVMIALAIICGPKLLVADEPTTALDVTIQAQILDLMKQINRDSGTGILFISHDLNVIRGICTRVLVMYAGRIVESGPVEEVFSRPRHEYTKGLIGSIPARERKGAPLTAIPGRVPAAGEGFPGCPFAPRCGRAEERCRAAFPSHTVVPSAGNGVPGKSPHCVYCVHAEEPA
ncbi:MAG: ABC transporter ATP-binding protein [Spirochaetaceae bacterium]|jgi:peptide/nickel transport system ATP-binding protein|nr:ABC transporter ATP-binding protein [Spirochaetaceae bacterium]